MHGVAPQCAVKVAVPSLGGEAGGRSLGFISLTARGNRGAGHLPTVQVAGARPLSAMQLAGGLDVEI